jgi:predicted dehydrogenase
MKTMEQSQACKVAIVGAGSMAREHIRAFSDVPGVKIAGITSRTRAKAEALAAEFKIPNVCDSVDELYERTKAELVVVTVFELAMQPVSHACFKHPWAALLEKPAGYTVAIAESIAADAREKGRKAFVALNRRFYSSTREGLRRLSEIQGRRYIRVQDQQDLAVARQIGHPDAVVQNWMYANSIHLVDYLNVFGRGKVTGVNVLSRFNPAKPGLVLAEIGFESGDAGLYEGLWDGPGPWAVSVATPAERHEFRPLEQGNYQLRGTRALNPFEIHPRDTAFKAGFRLQAELAVQSALGRATDLPTLEDGLESMRLVQKIFS